MIKMYLIEYYKYVYNLKSVFEINSLQCIRQISHINMYTY